MPTINEQLQDAAIDHAVDIQQYASGAVVAIIRILNRADAEMSAALLVALDGLDPASVTVERIEAALSEVRRINNAAYDAVEAELRQELSGLAETQSDWEYGLLVGLLPLLVRQKYPVNAINAVDAFNRAMSEPMQGRTLSSWIRNASDARMVSIVNRARDGFLNGETVEQILAALRGTRANKYSDGVLQRARKNIEAIVRTSIGKLVELIREQFIGSNEKLIKAEKWVSVLDSHTTPQCRVRDGRLYTVGTHKPIGHKIPWLQGPGALHWRCRSTSSIVVRSADALQVAGLSEEDRMALDGKVPADTTYAQWLSRQSEKRQIEILGKERALLYRNGNLTFGEMYSNTGQWLTLDQLRLRNRI